MAYDGWVEFGGTELFNLSRTVQLAEALGIDSVWITPESVAWIETWLGGSDYDDITEAPWYDPEYPASAEFAGIIPLSFAGLDDSTRESTPVEYITDGGNPGRARSGTLPIVANVAIVASTDRGADFGKRWLTRLLRGGSMNSTTCSGADLTYFRYAGSGTETVHRRNVKVTRAPSVTRKRSADCNVTWLVTFTLTAGDPYEYGEAVSIIETLGTSGASGSGIIESGALALVESGCPTYNYDPIYDPLYPALVESPTAPDFLPAGWDIAEGDTFDRFWAKVSPLQPSSLMTVPRITLFSVGSARMVRVSIWSSEQDEYEQCDPLFVAIMTYIPSNMDFVVDGEQQVAYAWDGFSPQVRRTDSLVYSTDARPVQWPAFNDPDYLIVTIDVFSGSGSGGGDTDVRMALDLIQKSD